MLDDQFWIFASSYQRYEWNSITPKNSVPVLQSPMLGGFITPLPIHPKGIGWSSIIPENAVPLLHSPMLGGFILLLPTLGVVHGVNSISNAFSMDIIQNVRN